MAGLVEFADSLGQRKHTRRKVSRSCKHTAKSNLRGALAVRAGHSQREAKRERERESERSVKAPVSQDTLGVPGQKHRPYAG